MQGKFTIIKDLAFVEPGSVVPPGTVIPSLTRWGGNPGESLKQDLCTTVVLLTDRCSYRTSSATGRSSGDDAGNGRGGSQGEV